MASVKIIGKVAVKVMPDTTDFKKKLEQELDTIEKQIGDLKVDVVPQISKAARELVKKQMESLRRELDGKNANFDVGIDRNGSDFAVTEAAIAALTRDRKVNIGVDFDRNSVQSAFDSILMLGGARPQLDALAEGFEKLRNLDYIAIQTGIMATKTTLLGGAALAATGHLFSLGSDLATISRIGFALPGILGGIVIGMGATAAAFADFNEYVPQASQYMSELQNTISSNFWEVAAGRINTFIDGVFPVLYKNLSDTGAVLGEFWGALAEQAGTQLNPALKGMFMDLNESIVIATGSVDSIVNIIKVLGQTGAGYLPALAQWFADITDQFSAFLTKAPLTAWVDEGITNLQALGSVLMSTYSIFNGIAAAAQAAGGATLVGLAAGLKDIAATVQSDAFQSGLTDVFITAFDMMDRITNLAGPGLKAMILSVADTFNAVGPGMATAIGSVLGAIGTAFSDPAVQASALTFFAGLTSAIESLTPAVGPIVTMLSSLGPVLGALLTQISAIAVAGVDKLAPTFTKIADASVPIIEKLGGLIQSVFESLTPVFQAAGENVAKLVTAFGPLIDAVQDLWNKVAPLLVPVLKVVVSILGDMLMGVITGVTMVFQGLVKIVSGVVDVFKGIGDVIAGIFTGDFSRIGEGFGQIFGGLKDIVLGALEGVAGAFWAWINGSFFAVFRKAGLFLLGKVTPIFGKIGDFILDVITFPFGNVGTKIAQPFIDAFNFLKGIFTTGFGAVGETTNVFFTVFKTIFEAAFTVIKTIITTAWTVISGIFNIAFTAIRAVVGAAWAGIVEFFQTTMNALYFVFKGPWDSIADFLTGLWTNIKAGAMLIWDALRAWFDEFLLKMSIRFEDAWNGIKTATSDIWNGIKSFFTEWWGNLQTVFTSAIGKVKNFLSDTWHDIKVISSDIWDGIKDKIKGIWDTISVYVGDKVGAVRDKLAEVWGVIKSKVSDIWDGISTKISGIWTDIKSSVETAVTTVKTKMGEAWDKIKTEVGEAWGKVKTEVETKIGEVVTFVKELPGKMVTAIGDLSTTLKASGAALINGFWEGISAKFTEVKNLVAGKLADLRDLFPFSPAKEGPFSGRGYTTHSGRALMSDFGKGMASQQKAVVSAALGVMDEVSKVIDDTSADYKINVEAGLDTSGMNLSAIGGLAATVSAADPGTNGAAAQGNVQIDNLSIPLEDLEQLKSLEDFLDMLRVRTRQGVVNA